MTKTEQLARGLEAMGYKEVASRSGKYRTFHKEGVRFPYLFLGKGAALRGNVAKRSSDSYSLTDKTKEMFIAKGAAA